jgi:hypothetical protein
MRKPLTLAWLLVASVLFLVPGSGTSATAEPGPGYFATNNVQWLGNIPLNSDSAGARIVGNYLYVTEDRGLTIYDISDPELPKPTGFHPLPQQAYFTEEDVDTNGKILLIGSFGDLTDGVGPINNLFVFNVENKNLPRLVGQVQGGDAHTISCVLDCTWAYASNGRIIDIRNPAAPVLAGNWRTASGAPSAHDVTEVAPGIVVTSTNPLFVLDAREDPTQPKVLVKANPPDNRFIHGNLWPHGGTDRFLLAGGETGGDCNPTNAGAFMTFEKVVDPETQKVTGFQYRDQYRVPTDTGLPSDGQSPYDQYCAHWFTTQPSYKDGGVVAAGWYEHGTRFLRVSPTDGKITELGWFLPLGGSTSAAYWVTDQILYSVDYQRGIDILRFTNQPATDEMYVPGDPGLAVGASAPQLRPGTDAVRSKDTPFVCPVPGGLRVA